MSPGSFVEDGAVLGPGTIVPAGRHVPANQMWAGNPAKFVRNVSAEEVAAHRAEAEATAILADDHGDEFEPHSTAFRAAEGFRASVGKLE